MSHRTGDNIHTSVKYDHEIIKNVVFRNFSQTEKERFSNWLNFLEWVDISGCVSNYGKTTPEDIKCFNSKNKTTNLDCFGINSLNIEVIFTVSSPMFSSLLN